MKLIKSISLFVLVLVVTIALSAICVYYQFNYSSSVNSQKQEFEIKEGQGVLEISQNLAKNKIYSKPIIFRLFTIYSGTYSKLRAGTYLISPNLNLKDLINIFVKGDIYKGKITTQEGWRMGQIVDYLVEEEIVDREDFEELLQASLYKETNFPKGFDGESLEGLLFPDTYYLEKDVKPKEIIQLMLDNFINRTDNYKLLQNKFGITEYELIILASIVEREAKNQKDRELIASVYLNRINQEMKLEACPTVQYAKSDSWDEIDLDDIQNTISIYNTYLYHGLPPTPIALPSLDSMRAVIDAPNTEYLYFFSNSEGKTFFSKTGQEHEEKKQIEL